MKEPWKWIVLGGVVFVLAFFLALPLFLGGGWGMMGPGMMGGYGGGMHGWFGGWMILPMLAGVLLFVGIVIVVVLLALRLGRGSTDPASARPCPNCGKFVQSDWVTCPYCGQKLT